MNAFTLLAFLLATTSWVQGSEEMVESVWISPGIITQSDTSTVYAHRPESSMISRTLHRRSARSLPSSCRFPMDLPDSELDCVIYPSKVLCTQTCVFGHTLNGGISRKMQCMLEENRWTPVSDFEKCKPFIDCGITVGAGGNFKCSKNFMDRGTTCEISCTHYEDKTAVPKATYQCDIRGKWSPELPFCVTAGTGIMLVPEPSGPKSIKEIW